MPELTIDGAALYYEQHEGDAAQPVLVFLHEGLGCTAMWKNFPHQLCQATGWRGLSYDRRGYGRSAPFGSPRTIHYMHLVAFDEVPQVLAALIPDDPYVIVGHSDGGTIALLHGAEKPPNLRGIVSIAAHVLVEPVSLTGIHTAIAAYESGKLGALRRYHGDQVDAVFHAWADTWLSPWFQAWNIEYALPAIDVPTLVMQGSEDQYATVAQVDAIVRGAPRGRGLIIDGGSHSPHLDHAAEVIEAIKGFVAALGG